MAKKALALNGTRLGTCEIRVAVSHKRKGRAAAAVRRSVPGCLYPSVPGPNPPEGSGGGLFAMPAPPLPSL